MRNHGTLEPGPHGNYRLRFQRQYPHPAEKVWRALIEPSQLKHWFPTAIVGERKQGATLRFIFEGTDMPAMEGTLKVFDPPRVLEFAWGKDLLRFELTAEADGCKLIFITTFDERSIAPRSAAGWHACLDKLASCFGTPARAAHSPSWPKLYQEYAKQFGPSDFPAFVSAAGIAVRDAMRTPGLDGHEFSGHGNTHVELLRAGRDAELPERPAAPHEYLFVIEGRCELRLGGGEIVLEAGMEFQFPAGMPVTGKVTAGTRLLRAVSTPASTTGSEA